MGILKKDTNCLLLKTKKYKKYDFFEEHQKMIKKNNYIWIMKTGRKIKDDYLKEIIKSKGGLILKTPGRKEYDLYFCELIDYNTENVDNIFPEYYSEIFKEEGVNFSKSLEIYTWFKIKNMKKIPKEYIRHFVNKNGDSIENGATKGMVPYLYTKNDIDLEI